MKVARSVAEVLSQHTTLALECIDRLYLNVYVPVLQRAAGAAYFFRTIRGLQRAVVGVDGADHAAFRRCHQAFR